MTDIQSSRKTRTKFVTHTFSMNSSEGREWSNLYLLIVQRRHNAITDISIGYPDHELAKCILWESAAYFEQNTTKIFVNLVLNKTACNVDEMFDVVVKTNDYENAKSIATIMRIAL